MGCRWTKVPVHENPSSNSRVLAHLSNARNSNENGVARQSASSVVGIYLPQSKVGWIRADKLRGRDDYHACCANISGKWKLVLFERS